MTREEIFALDMGDLQTRSIEIAEEVKTAEADALEALDAELTAIEERKNEIKAEAEEKRAAMLEVLKGEGETIEVKQEEKTKMNLREARNTDAYIDAYAEYIKGRTDGTECRALLTELADLGSDEKGTIAVPTYIEDRIMTAWENDDILSRVRRTFFKGVLKVGYEASASGASVHMEGGDPVDEESLEIKYVELVPRMVKKLVRVSDEAMDMRGRAFLDYLYDEIEYQIVKLVANGIVAEIEASELTAEAELGAAIAVSDIVTAEGYLGGEAANPVVIMSRSNASAYKAAALAANFAFDVFDGMPVVYSDALDEAEFIIADLSGAQANFPDGADVKFKFDDLTEAAADMIRIIGRLYVGIGVVAPGKFVKGVLGSDSE